jgi:GH24 family phage-related lysozyme (muramidase)
MTTPDPAWLAPALALIKEFEGCRLEAYPDPGTGGAPWTIGWGTTTYYDGTPVRKGDTISQELADAMLACRVWVDGLSLARTVPGWGDLNANQRAALVSFTYNVGPSWFGGEGFATITGRVRDARWAEVPAALMLYVNPGSPVEAGLKRRRKAEGALWAKPMAGQVPPAPAPPAVPPVAAAGVPVWPAGMVGPKKRPDLRPGDHHLIVNDVNETCTAYSHDGRQLWRVPCLARGQGKEAEWEQTGSDTPPGLYLCGKVYRDYDEDPTARFTPDRRAYGWYSIDLLGQEGQEGPTSRPYRDGIMIHGGGSACGFPGAWAPRQPLHATRGCIRMHNQDIRDRVLPLLDMGRVWVSVLQEAK